MKDDLGMRMKGYEHNSRDFLMKKCPVLIRLDGKAFHTFTRGFDRPFDEALHDSMLETAQFLVDTVQGCVFAYTQSDEISLLLVDNTSVKTDAFFNYNVQKMSSITASLATAKFNSCFEHKKKPTKPALFDSRAWNIPPEELVNYFIWRQQDATRNSVQMVAQSVFSHKVLQGLSCSKLQDKLMLDKGINWNDFEVWKKRGSCVVSKTIEVSGKNRKKHFKDEEPPIFTTDREYVDRYWNGSY